MPRTEKPQYKHSVTLDKDTHAALKVLGRGNASRGIREAVRLLEESRVYVLYGYPPFDEAKS